MKNIKIYILIILTISCCLASNWIHPVRGGIASHLLFGNGVILLQYRNGGFFSTDGSVWTSFQYNNLPTEAGLIIDKPYFLNGSFIASVKTDDKISFYVSTDGINWDKRGDCNTKCNLADLTWGNNLFVGILSCDNDSIITSPDLINWKCYNHGASRRIFDHVTFGNNIFVGISKFGSITTSPDGINWTWDDRLEETTWHINDIVFADSTFIAVRNDGHILRSFNGIDWNSSISLEVKSLTHITYEKNKFYILTNSFARHYTSENGIDWKLNHTSGTNSSSKLVYGNETFMTLTTNGDILISRDNDSSWEIVHGATGSLHDVTYGDGKYVLVGHNGLLCTSDDAVQWTERISGTQNSINKIIWGNNRFIALESTGRLLTTEDCISWSEINFYDSSIIQSIFFGDSFFLVIDSRSNLFISYDGLSWERTFTPETLPNDSKYLVYGKECFIYLDNSNWVFRSGDGRNWVKDTSNVFLNDIGFIIYGDSGFAMFNNHNLYHSTNGLDWHQISITQILPDTTKNYFFNTATYGQGYYITVDFNSGLHLYSKNGKNWGSLAGDASCKLYYGGGKFILLPTSVNSAALALSTQFDPPPITTIKKNLDKVISTELRNNVITFPGNHNGKRINYIIYDISGRTLHNKSVIVHENKIRIDMASHAKGVYIVSIKGNENIHYRYIVY